MDNKKIIERNLQKLYDKYGKDDFFDITVRFLEKNYNVVIDFWGF
jgi:hypothetical protein